MPDPRALAQLLRLGSAPREDALLQAQMAQAAQAAQPRGRVYNTAGGAIMGALGDGLREMAGGFRQQGLQRDATQAETGRVDARQQWLSAALRGQPPPAGAVPVEQSPQEQAAGMAAALRGEPAPETQAAAPARPDALTQLAPYQPGPILGGGVTAAGTPAAALAGQGGGPTLLGNALRAKLSGPAVAAQAPGAAPPGAGDSPAAPGISEVPRPMESAPAVTPEPPKSPADAPEMSIEQRAEMAIASGDPAMTAWGKTVLELANLRETLGAQQRAAQEKAGAAKTEAEDKAKGERFERALKLRQEFSKLPQTQAIVDVNTARQKVATATSDGAGDLSLIYGFMRLLDPGSSVKESEFDNAAKTQGIPGQVLALRAKIFADGMLDDTARRAIKREAETLYKAHYKSFEPTLKSYRGLADRYGFDLDEIIPELGLNAKTPAARPAALVGPGNKRFVLQSDGTYLPEE